MKLKYYLRGLSIGILFATIVLSISFRTNSKTDITDEEIIKKAEELGMTMRDDDDLKLDQLLNGLITPTVIPSTESTETNNTSSGDPDSQNSNGATSQGETTEEAEPKDEPVIEPTKTVESKDEPIIEPTESIEPTSTVEPTNEVEQEDDSNTSAIEEVKVGEYVTFEILPGMTSYEVAKVLKSVGLIDDVWKFNRYMAENKYVRIIDFGTYKIKKGSTYQEISKEIIIK